MAFGVVTRRRVRSGIGEFQSKNKLVAGESLTQGGQAIVSPNGNVTLRIGKDGNLVVEAKVGITTTTLWGAGTETHGTKAIMQGDGNFVVYDTTTNAPLFTTQTQGNPGAHAEIQDDGNFAVFRSDGSPAWDAQSHGGMKAPQYSDSTHSYTSPDLSKGLTTPYNTLVLPGQSSETSDDSGMSTEKKVAIAAGGVGVIGIIVWFLFGRGRK